MSVMKLYVDEIGAAIVAALESVQSELGLVCIEQGDWASMPGPESFDDIMPMALVSFLSTDSPELRMERLRVVYKFRVRLFRRQRGADETEESVREMNQMASRVWQILATDSERPYNIPAWAKASGGAIAEGCQFQEVHVFGPNLYNDENMILNSPELSAHCAWVDMSITAVSVPHEE